MDLRYSESDEAFRAELRDWLERYAARAPAEPSARTTGPAAARYDTDWQRRLFDAGYAGHQLAEGVRRPRTRRRPSSSIFLEETDAGPGAVRRGELRRPAARRADDHGRGHATSRRRATCPRSCGATRCGARASREPGAGLRPRVAAHAGGARRRRLRGHRPEDLELLRARSPTTASCSCAPTPTRRSTAGITWLILPDGPARHRGPADRRRCSGSTEFCEVFLDEVRVPVANRVGAENDGWRVTMVTFSFERGTAFVSELVDGDAAWPRTSRRYVHGPGAPARARPRRRRARRAVGAHQAQRDPGGRRRVARARRVHVQARVLGEPVRSSATCRLRVLDRDALDVDGKGEFVEERLRTLALTIAAGHVADPAQHHRRARARPARGSRASGLRAHRRPGRAPRRDPQPAARAGSRSSRVREGFDRAALRRARRSGRVLAALPTGFGVGRRRGRVRGARPGGRARAAGVGTFAPASSTASPAVSRSRTVAGPRHGRAPRRPRRAPRARRRRRRGRSTRPDRRAVPVARPLDPLTPVAARRRAAGGRAGRRRRGRGPARGSKARC